MHNFKSTPSGKHNPTYNALVFPDLQLQDVKGREWISTPREMNTIQEWVRGTRGATSLLWERVLGVFAATEVIVASY